MNISGPGIKTETASNPAEQQLLAQPGKNTVILDKNFEIVDPKQPLALAASPMSEEGEFGKRGGFYHQRDGIISKILEKYS